MNKIEILSKIKNYQIPFKKINQELGSKILSWEMEYNNDISEINEMVARNLLYQISQDIFGGVEEINFVNKSKNPKNQFQMRMDLGEFVIWTDPFIYVNDKHKIISKNTKIIILDSNYEDVAILKEIGDNSLSPYSYNNEDTTLKFDRGMLRGASTWKFKTPENNYEVNINYTGGKNIFPGSNIGVPKFMTYEGHLDTTQEGKPLKVMATITAILRKELLQNFEGKPVIEYLDYIVWPASEEKFGTYNIQSKHQRNKLYKVFLEKQLPQYIDSWVDKEGYFGFKVKK